MKDGSFDQCNTLRDLGLVRMYRLPLFRGVKVEQVQLWNLKNVGVYIDNSDKLTSSVFVCNTCFLH